MDENVIFISQNKVRELLDWNTLADKIEDVCIQVAKGEKLVTQMTRCSLPCSKGVLSMMPCCLQSKLTNNEIISCKMLSVFPKNEHLQKPLPKILAQILLFDPENGMLKCVMDGTEITGWRTAATSAIVSKHLHFDRLAHRCDILSILGCGVQAKMHALCYQHFFYFREVRFWARDTKKAEKLVQELKRLGIKGTFQYFKRIEDCLSGADVIITATFSTEPLVFYKWVKPNAHIVALGVDPGRDVRELDNEIYKNAWLCVDSIESARKELPVLEESGAVIEAEIFEILAKKKKLPPHSKMTVFHSLGMAIEDTIVAKLIYEKYQQKDCTNFENSTENNHH